jgi:quinol monooxygenase YgiN
MPDQAVCVIARVRSKPTDVDQVRAILTAIVEPTRHEPGCIRYHLLEDQSDPGAFATVEEWASAESEKAHFSTPHILTALRQLAGLLTAEPDIRCYTMVR